MQKPAPLDFSLLLQKLRIDEAKVGLRTENKINKIKPISDLVPPSDRKHETELIRRTRFTRDLQLPLLKSIYWRERKMMNLNLPLKIRLFPWPQKL